MSGQKQQNESTPVADEDEVVDVEIAVAAGAGAAAAPLVTPSTTLASRNDTEDAHETTPTTNARRTLFPSRTTTVRSTVSPLSLVTPQSSKRKADEEEGCVDIKTPPAKRRLVFGKYVDLIVCPPNVEEVYKIIRRLTGSIGGNAHSGPIYGELTMGHMQKMIKLMMEHTGLNSESRFIDVGSGIGKPNLHVAQYPGVSFSCGVEVESPRWWLGMTCLKAILDQAVAQRATTNDEDIDQASRIRGNTVFLQKDITDARTFDPFTHVYMFSIGFPPPLWIKLAEMWNRSQCPYLICYHGPRDTIEIYEFDVQLVAQTTTSMHGSKENHMGYIYKRKSVTKKVRANKCDPLFAPAWDLVNKGLLALHEDVAKEVEIAMGRGRKTRSRK